MTAPVLTHPATLFINDQNHLASIMAADCMLDVRTKRIKDRNGTHTVYDVGDCIDVILHAYNRSTIHIDDGETQTTRPFREAGYCIIGRYRRLKIPKMLGRF